MNKIVKNLQGGEILSKPVLKSENEILIDKDTVLKQTYLDLLDDFHIRVVSVTDKYDIFVKPHRMIEESKKEEYILKIRRILEGHIYRDIYHGNHSLQQIKELADKLIDDLPDMKENIVYDIEPYEGNLYEHSFMVAMLSICVGKKLELSRETLLEIAQGCLIHDLGLRYITVSYKDFSIENRSSAEIFEMKKHTILGYSALESADWLSDTVKSMVLSHHEKKDGSGYPLKQKSKNIECQIIQLCDTFDCMISGMECEGMDVPEAIDKIISTKEDLYDDKISAVFLEMVAHYPVGTILERDGKRGIVIEQTEKTESPFLGFYDKKSNT